MSNLLELSEDVLQLIVEHTGLYGVRLYYVCKRLAPYWDAIRLSVSTKASTKLIKWYKSIQLTGTLVNRGQRAALLNEAVWCPPLYTTTWTYTRYLTTYYPLRWLCLYPKAAIETCPRIVLDEEDMYYKNKLPVAGIVGKVRYFITKYMNIGQIYHTCLVYFRRYPDEEVRFHTPGIRTIYSSRSPPPSDDDY